MDEAHELIRNKYSDYADDTYDPEYASGYCNAVLFVLETLGIKIEGVNASDND